MYQYAVLDNTGVELGLSHDARGAELMAAWYQAKGISTITQFIGEPEPELTKYARLRCELLEARN